MTPRTEFRTFGQLALAGALVAALIAGGQYFVDSIGRVGAEREAKTLLAIASTAAAAMEPEKVANLIGPSGPARITARREISDELRRLRGALQNARSAYLATRDGGSVSVLAYTGDIPAPAGTPSVWNHAQATEKLGDVFRSGKAETITYREKTAEWTSVFAPVLRPGTQNVIAVVGFDMPAAQWQIDLARYRQFAMIVFGLVTVIVVLAAAAVFVQSRAQRRVARLNNELEDEADALSLANRIVENSSTIAFRLDADPELPLVYISRNIQRYGYRAEELVRAAKHWRDLIHADDQEGVRADFQALRAGRAERSKRQLRFARADGKWIWFESELGAVHDKLGRVTAFEGLLTDITDSKEAEAHVAHLISHDGLTGLANRTEFVKQLQIAFSQSKRGGESFAVLYLDIDHFKDINDVFGHEKGDMFLLIVAERLKNMIRDADTLGHFSVARFGGDEFAVLQTNVGDPSDAAALAQRINLSLAEPYAVDGNDIHATVSIGISLYDISLKDPNEMLMQADLALYRAKDAGRNQFHFHSADLDIAVRERVAIGEDLHAALQKGQLELYYQPQVEMPSGRIVGLEALMRWNHPTRGLVAPTVFIAVAEKSGIISAMGKWAVEEACKQVRHWRAIGCSPPIVGVNVSAIQLRNADLFVDSVQKALKQSGLGPDALELELTESVMVEATEAHGDVLHRLRDIGVRITIDDFGTGYSSLQYLQSHPISRIKIAQQFMTNVVHAQGDAAIVRATIGLAQALNLDVVAEGVEDADQLSFLVAAGCRTVQGFLFSPPVEAQHMVGMLRRGRFDPPRTTTTKNITVVR